MFRNNKMMTMRVWNLFIFISAFITISDAKNASKILGGQMILMEEYPHHVSIRYHGQHFCGASLISHSYVLTSASCILLDTEPVVMLSNLQVMTGTSDKLGGENPHECIQDISLVIYHPFYSPKDFWRDDIAVLKLSSPIVPSFRRSTIILLDFPIKTKGNARIVGWREVVHPADSSSRHLQLLKIKLNTRKQCIEVFRFHTIFSQACASTVNSNEAATLGDSGNGIVLLHNRKERIFGVVSGILMNNIILFTKIHEYTSWIENEILVY